MATPFSSHVLVTIQFISIAAGLIPFAGHSGSPFWLTATVVGIGVGLYTLLHNRLGNFGVYPEPLGHAELVTSGPYQWVRHPMYLAVLLFMVGVAMYNGHLLHLLSLITLTLAIIGKMNREEAYLREHFDEYGDYSCTNKRLVPFLY